MKALKFVHANVKFLHAHAHVRVYTCTQSVNDVIHIRLGVAKSLKLLCAKLVLAKIAKFNRCN